MNGNRKRENRVFRPLIGLWIGSDIFPDVDGYGFTVYGTKGVIQGGKFGGYDPLVADIIKFFKTGKVPVPAEETIEIFAFMSAADVSKARGGREVSLSDLIEKAKKGKKSRRNR